jgi:hypothetical protein
MRDERKPLLFAIACCTLASISCGEAHYTWAFAQNLDNTFHPNETCRQSLAESLYAPSNSERLVRQGNSNVHLFTGQLESYRVYAYHSQGECETALNGMVLRQQR